MGNSILQSLPQQQNNITNLISQIQGAMGGRSPQMFFNNLMQTNPQFANFVNANQGKTPQQIASEYGLNFSQIQHLFK